MTSSALVSKFALFQCCQHGMLTLYYTLSRLCWLCFIKMSKLIRNNEMLSHSLVVKALEGSELLKCFIGGTTEDVFFCIFKTNTCGCLCSSSLWLILLELHQNSQAACLIAPVFPRFKSNVCIRHKCPPVLSCHCVCYLYTTKMTKSSAFLDLHWKQLIKQDNLDYFSDFYKSPA